MQKYINILIITFAFVVNAFAKYGIPSTEGKEFFVTYMLNYGSTENTDSLSLQLIFSAKQTTNITISNPQTGWNDVHTIPANQVTTITLPRNQCYASKAEQIEKRGLNIKASTPISVYASNFHPYSYDATILFPKEALGKQYIIQTYENLRWRKEFTIVATENNTTIQIKPHANTTKGSRKNIWKSISLNKGETYLVMSLDSHNDLSGSEIVADKPIAVFSGHKCADIPVGNHWCDHIVEQQTPVNMWGKRFAVTKGALAKSNSIIVTASENNTIIKRNGSKVATINKDDSYEFRLTDNSAFIETSKPAACYLYVEGAEENKIGDPSSVQINPIEQSLSDITFATFQRNVSRTHYINIITTKEGATEAKLNGKNINGKFQKLTGNNSLYYAQIRINHGVHRLTTTKDGFSGYVYGIGYCESYAYSIGSATMDLEAGILVDSIPHENKVYDENRCYLNSILFSPNISVEYDHIHWDFGDGSSSDMSEISHTYSIPGTYTIQMIATKGIVADTAYTTLVLNDIYTDTIHANICELDSYDFYGTTYSESGTYTKSFSNTSNCDSVVTLVLTVHQPFFAQETAELKRGSSLQWHNKWYRDPGVYYDSLKSVFGCDSVYELTLEPIASDLVMYDTICWQAEYEFHGITYSLPPVSGNESSDYIDYTLEYRDKDNCAAYVMNLAISNISDDAYTITDTISEGNVYNWLGDSYTESGIYTKTISRGYGCAQRDYTLDLTVLPFPVVKVDDTLCVGDTIHFRDKIYSKAGVYRDTLVNPTGIEAIYQLTLHDNRSTEEIYVSNVTSYDFNGTTLTESGTYYDTISNAMGCDSIIILHLGINEKCTITEEESMTICEGKTITWNDIVCDAEQTYQKTFTSTSGCDSICILHLSFTSPKETKISDSICEGEYYRLDTLKLITTGIYSHTFIASNGCDSVVTLNLTVLQSTDSVDNVEICEGEVYTWHGNVYSAPIDITETLLNSLGCDSICSLHLKVNPILLGDTMASTYGSSFSWYGTEYTTSGDYPHTLTSKVTGCDSIVTLHLKVLSYEENCYSTEGTEFFVAFMPNDDSDTEELKLFATSRYNASMTISNSRMGWSTSISIPANGSNSIIVPNNYGFTSETEFETVLNKGLIVTSTAPISLFASNALEGSHRDWDAANILPSNILSSKYIVQTITPTNPGRPEFALLATEDSTTIDINLTAQTSGGHQVGHPYQIVLNRGQVYMCYGSSTTADFSGTLIDAHDKKIAVFNGVNQTCIPSDKKAADHLYEQAIPIENLGKRFAITSTRERQRDLVKITAISNSTDIFVDGVKVTTINARQSYEFTVVSPKTSCYIETSNPVVCNLFLMSHAVNNQYRSNIGDPAMVAVYPIEQTTDYITFATVSTSQTCEHYVNIVTATNNINEIKVDGLDISSSFELLSGNSAYSFARLAVTEGSHTISSSGTGFLGHVYGLARVESYAYSLGTTLCDINDYHLDGDTTRMTICEDENLIWHGLTPTTTGIHETYEKSVVTGFDSLCVLDLTVLPKLYGDTMATFCNGSFYTWWGEMYTEKGNYTQTFQSQVTGCDSIVTLHLEELPKFHGDTIASVCSGSSLKWWGNTYASQGEYTHTYISHVAPYCDSIVTLHLNILPPLLSTFNETITEGATYIWNEQTYSEKGSYTQNFTTAEGCDSIVTLNLTVNPLTYDILAHIQCADDPYIEFDVTASDGLFHQLQFVFTPKAIAQHFHDTIVDYSTSQILIPNSARAGLYDVAISPRFNNQVLDTRNIQFTLLYPSSVLDQHWDDFIGVLTHNFNGGYDFISFQWYKNGQPMAGENHSYTYQALEMGAAYSAMLEEQDGTKLMTCEIIAMPQTEISIYPTLLQPHQIMRLHNTTDITIWLYDNLGKMIYTNSFYPGDHQLAAPQNTGVYIIRIQQAGKSSKIETKKLIVR